MQPAEEQPHAPAETAPTPVAIRVAALKKGGTVEIEFDQSVTGLQMNVKATRAFIRSLSKAALEADRNRRQK